MGIFLIHQFRAVYHDCVLDYTLPIHGVYLSADHIYCVTQWGCVQLDRKTWHGKFYPHIWDHFTEAEKHAYWWWIELRRYDPDPFAYPYRKFYDSFPSIGSTEEPALVPPGAPRNSNVSERRDAETSGSGQDDEMPVFALPPSVLDGAISSYPRRSADMPPT